MKVLLWYITVYMTDLGHLLCVTHQLLPDFSWDWIGQHCCAQHKTQFIQGKWAFILCIYWVPIVLCQHFVYCIWRCKVTFMQMTHPYIHPVSLMSRIGRLPRWTALIVTLQIVLCATDFSSVTQRQNFSGTHSHILSANQLQIFSCWCRYWLVEEHGLRTGSSLWKRHLSLQD